MKPSHWIVLATGLLFAAAGGADAQVLSRLPLSLHARVGAGLPTGGFASAESGIAAEPGAAWEVGGVLRLLPWAGAYAGFQQESFGCGECAGVRLDETALSRGWEAGGELVSPIRPLGLAPWVRAGAVRHSLRLSRGQSSLVSRPGLGLGLGAGIRLPLGALVLSPGVRYQSYSVEVELGERPSRTLDVSQLTVDFGLLLPF